MPYKDPAAQAAYRKQYYEANKVALLEKQRLYQQATAEQRAATNKARYNRKHAEVRAKQKEYADANRDKINVQARAYREANREELNRQAKERYHANKLKKAKDALVNGAKRRAEANGLEFDLTVSGLVWPSYCPVLGLELTYNGQTGGRDSRASLDRLDPSKGYTLANTKVISSRANRIKSDATLRELELIFKYTKANST